jgi:hypothetical protein
LEMLRDGLDRDRKRSRQVLHRRGAAGEPFKDRPACGIGERSKGDTELIDGLVRLSG